MFINMFILFKSSQVKSYYIELTYFFKEISLYFSCNFLAVFNDGKARTLVSLTGTIEVFYEGKLHHKDNWPLPLFYGQERLLLHMSKNAANKTLLHIVL